MAIIVQKYGGSSVADVAKLQRVADQVCEVKRAGYDVVVVVSAMGRTTDELLAKAKQLSDAPPRRELDMLLSVGERISMALLSIAIQSRGLSAVSLTGSQCGIITNNRHSDARIIEVRPFRIQDELDRGAIVIVAGFQGVSYTREVTTLGRGGSDTTAVALAAALQAERCEIYSDVDGVYSADPRQIAEARHLPEISYPEMQEMAEAGAKVLNAQAVEFAKRANIALYCRASFQPGRETIVRRDVPLEEHGVRAVVSEERVVRVRLRGRTAAERIGDVVKVAEEQGVTIKELGVTAPGEGGGDAGGGGGVKLPWARGSFVVSLTNAPTWPAVMDRLRALAGDEIEVDEHLGALSLIGEGVNKDNGNLLRALGVLESIGVRPGGVATTGFRISLLVDRSRLLDAKRACHQAFVENAAVCSPLDSDAVASQV
jgi:aspartate kinase